MLAEQKFRNSKPIRLVQSMKRFAARATNQLPGAVAACSARLNGVSQKIPLTKLSNCVTGGDGFYVSEMYSRP